MIGRGLCGEAKSLEISNSRFLDDIEYIGWMWDRTRDQSIKNVK
jgi:hypothetical protein